MNRLPSRLPLLLGAVLCGLFTTAPGCISEQRATSSVDTTQPPGDTGPDVEVATCSDASDCDDSDPCTQDTCGPDGDCVHTTDSSCESCSLATDCTGADGCSSASCVGDRCIYNVADGCRLCATNADCDDGDACTSDDCDGGTCSYGPRSCVDADPCTVGSCDPAQGCLFEDTCAPPRVDLGADAILREGDRFDRSGTVSGPPHETFTVQVDYGDGTTEEVPLSALATFSLDHVYMADGTYTVTVTVTDGRDRQGSAKLVVTVMNAAPEISLEPGADPDEGAAWTGSGTVTDPGDDTLTATVSYGDGSDTEAVALAPDGSFELTHTFADDGRYTVVLEVSDGGPGVRREATLTVANVAPTVETPATQLVDEGELRTLTIPITDPGADTHSGTYNDGKGQPSKPLMFDDDGAIVLPLSYSDDAIYTVTLSVSDDEGAATSTTFLVVASNVAPVVTAPDNLVVGEGEPFDVAVPFTDPGTDTWSSQVSFGDSTGIHYLDVESDKTVVLSHSYPQNSVRIVFVEISDDDGGSDSTSFQVLVENRPPAAHLGADETVAEGISWTRAAMATDPGVEDTVGGTVDYGDGSPPETLAIDPIDGSYLLSHDYPQQGGFDVSVTVQDSDGASATEMIRLTVENVTPNIDCGSHAVLAEGETFARDCTFTDPGDDSWSGTVDYGLGAGPEPLALGADGTFSLSQRYDLEGTYAVALRIHDGTADGLASFDVAVGNAPPLVDAGPDLTQDEGAAFARVGRVFDAGVSDVFVATVDYGDGAGVVPLVIADDRTFNLSHSYADEGDYTVTVSVTDSDDETGEGSFVVTVTNVAPAITGAADATIPEGSRFSQAITISDPGVDDELDAWVDYGAGAGAEALVPPRGAHDLSAVYPQSGSYTVTLFASDQAGGDTTATLTVTVTNGAPVVTAPAPITIGEGGTVSTTATFTDAGADAFTALVDWGDGGDPEPAPIQDHTVALDHPYTDDGVYTVMLTVSDGEATGQASFTVTVDNLAPTVDAGDDGAVDEGGVFTQQGMFADPGILDALTATVDYGDGAGPIPLQLAPAGTFALSHSYTQDGAYDVTVRVTDDDGAEGADSLQVIVGNVPPSVDPGAPGSTAEGTAFTRTVTVSDPGADTLSATVDYGDGGDPESIPITGTSFAIAHTYADDGDYQVAIAVTDGADTTDATLPVTVTNAPPTVNAGGAATFAPGAAFARHGSVADPGINDSFTATVDYGDGAGPEALTIKGDRSFKLTHSWAASGSYTVVVVVTDNGALSGQDTFDITVSNSAPAVDAGPDDHIDEGATLQRVVSFTDAGSVSWTATADYSLGAGPVPAPVDDAARTVALSKVYADDGVYDVTVTVDDGVESGAGTFQLTVDNVAPTIAIAKSATVAEGTPWTREGSFADPGVLDAHTGTVDYGAGVGPQALPLSANDTFTLDTSWPDDGTYDVVVGIADGDGGHAWETVTVDVENVPPTLPILTPPTLNVGQAWSQVVAFTDPGADTWTVTVDYDDPPALAPRVLGQRTFTLSHTYNAPGTYDVSIQVADDDGGSTTQLLQVVVENVAPTVNAGADKTVNEGSVVNVVASFSDPGADTHTGLITWDAATSSPATIDEQARVATGTHTYTDNSVHTVDVQVTDEHQASGHDTLTITVLNVAPIVDAGGDGAADLTGRFTRGGTFVDPGADSWTVTVDYGDESGVETIPQANKAFSLDHTYTTDGDYTVTVTVADDDGDQGLAVFTVAVSTLDCSEIGAPQGHLWVGGDPAGPSDWHRAENWLPASVPGIADDVSLCTGSFQYPVVSQSDAAAGGLALASGASISVASGKTLKVSGDVLGGQITGSGTLEVSGDSAELTSDTPHLKVDAKITITSSVTVSGDVTMLPNQALALDGITVVVSGDFTSIVGPDTVSGLVMDASEDILIVSGDATWKSVGSAQATTLGKLTDGEIRVAGDFLQQAGGPGESFVSTGTLVVLGGGTQPSVVTFETPTTSRMSDVDVLGPGGARFDSSAAFTGLMWAPDAGTSIVSDHTLVFGALLPVIAEGVTYDVEATAVVGTVDLNWDLTLDTARSDLVVADGAELRIGVGTLDIGGDLHVDVVDDAASGLFMGGADAEVIVHGDAVWNADFSGATAGNGSSRLTAGNLRLYGDFHQVGQTAGVGVAFAPSGTRVTFAGEGAHAHAIGFTDPSMNRFGPVTLAAGGELWLDSTLAMSSLEASSAVPTRIQGAYDLVLGAVDMAFVSVFETRLRLGEGTITRFDDIAFDGHTPSDVQLGISRGSAELTFARLSFATMPGAGGAYLSAIDTTEPFTDCVVNIVDSTPLHGKPWTTSQNGFVIDWGTPTDDSDGDWLPDSAEFTNGSDVLNPDSDDDTFWDGTEVALGHSPTDDTSLPFSLGATASYGAGGSTSAFAVGQLNGEGGPDIAVANPDEDTVTLLIQDTNGAFTADYTLALGVDAEPLDVAIGDLTGDGVSEVVATRYGHDDVGIFTPEGAPTTWSELPPIAVPGGPAHLALANFDTLPLTDAAVTTLDGMLHVATRSIAGGDGWNLTSDAVAAPTGLAVGEIDGNVGTDAVVANGTTGDIDLFANSSTSPGDLSYLDSVFVGVTAGVAIADIDENALADIIVVVPGADALWIIYNNGDDGPSAVGPWPTGASPSSVSIADIDGNGTLDIATASAAGDHVLIYLQLDDPTVGIFVPYIVPGAANAQETEVWLGDLSGDGLVDIVTRNVGTNAIGVTLQTN